jgi:hypothetical protein
LQLQYFGGGGAGYPDLWGIWMTAGLLLDEDDAVDQNVRRRKISGEAASGQSGTAGLLLHGVVPRCFRGWLLCSVIPPVGYGRSKSVAMLHRCPTGYVSTLHRNRDEGPTGAMGDGSTGSA